MNGPVYRSSIPSSARERVVDRHPNGGKRHVEYGVGGKRVGIRLFQDDGSLDFEEPYRNGKRHGTKYTWHSAGVLASAEPFRNGLAHGKARQWDDKGRLLGTWKMVRGTGIDLWRQPFSGRRKGIYLSEVMPYQDGKFHGFEWWLDENQKTVWWERHWTNGVLHGIERGWNRHGRFARGSPAYSIRGQKVSKRAYLSACRHDPTLPPFTLQDNLPARRFPASVAKHLAGK